MTYLWSRYIFFRLCKKTTLHFFLFVSVYLFMELALKGTVLFSGSLGIKELGLYLLALTSKRTALFFSLSFCTAATFELVGMHKSGIVTTLISTVVSERRFPIPFMAWGCVCSILLGTHELIISTISTEYVDSVEGGLTKKRTFPIREIVQLSDSVIVSDPLNMVYASISKDHLTLHSKEGRIEASITLSSPIASIVSYPTGEIPLPTRKETAKEYRHSLFFSLLPVILISSILLMYWGIRSQKEVHSLIFLTALFFVFSLFILPAGAIIGGIFSLSSVYSDMISLTFLVFLTMMLALITQIRRYA